MMCSSTCELGPGQHNGWLATMHTRLSQCISCSHNYIQARLKSTDGIDAACINTQIRFKSSPQEHVDKASFLEQQLGT